MSQFHINIDNSGVDLESPGSGDLTVILSWRAYSSDYKFFGDSYK